MQYSGRPYSDPRKITVIAVLASVGTILFVFENQIPHPIPWFRLGIGNVSILLALFIYGPAEAIMVALIKFLLGNLISGRILSPSFILSGAGTAAGVAAMVLSAYFIYPKLSIVGVSLLGAFGHDVAQLAVASAIIVKRPLLPLVPPVVFFGTITGIVIGFLSHLILVRLRAMSLGTNITEESFRC